ncbi:MAG: hypothetical protein PWP76_141 [Candidatus Diapherotrites archaeon]|nr:hypothetical protein [Candidatus Diapherotrites archaeon]
MKIIYAMTGEVIHADKEKSQKGVKEIKGLEKALLALLVLVFVGIMLIPIISGIYYLLQNQDALKYAGDIGVLLLEISIIVFIVGIVIIIYSLGSEKRKLEKARKLASKLASMDIRIDGRRVIVDGKRPRLARGEYIKIRGRNVDIEYMVWKLHGETEGDKYLIMGRKGLLPMYDFGEFYVAFLPPGTKYYLKIKENLEIDTGMDKARLLQDPGEEEIEFHYVAGKSRDAHVLFDCCGVEVPILRAEGIPFQKHIVHAGATDDIYALIFDNPRLGTIWQDYYKYRQMRAHIGRYYVNGKGKVKLKLDFPMAPDKVAETEAEFVLASE